jgi:type VI secretion system protein ImpF
MMTPSRGEPDVRVKLSLLDRLCDDDTDSSSDRPMSRYQSIRQLKASLVRDMSALLNTKRRENEVPDEFVELNQSLLAYGLPDFTSYALRSPMEQNRLRREVESTIRRFEPRLLGVTVHLETRGEFDSGVRFRVDAQLKMEPEPEPVRFDTILEVDTSHFTIASENR